MVENAHDASTRQARVHRMVMPGHLCPYGLKVVDLLRRKGYRVDDHHLTTREETDAFMARHDVDTTPQVFIDGRRVGGYEEIREYFGLKVVKKDDTSYRPVVALFVVAALLALCASWLSFGTVFTVRSGEFFIAIAMTLLGLQKLKDVEGFSTMFLNYDLLAQRYPPYGYFYPYAETAAGVLMFAGVLVWLAAPVALFIGSVGTMSVFKAVYVDKRELKCACVGGDSQVPLGFVSLTENLLMVAMAVWMPLRMYVL